MTTAARARPLSVADRRASIIDAVIPLLLEHGAGITSRQISEAAGVAEGTVFRAFGDKESLIEAAFEAFMSGTDRTDGPLPDRTLPLEDKVVAFLAAMRSRVRDVMRMSAAAGRRPSGPPDHQHSLYRRRVYDVFGPHADELRLSLEDFGAYLRALAIGTTVPGSELGDDELARIILDGVRRPRSTAPGKD